MRYVADLHVHSPFSRAVSPRSTLSGFVAAARRKGVSVVATGDGTHPQWRKILGRELVEAEPGFYRLRGDDGEPPVRFILSAEISSIYTRGRGRRIHTLCYFPDREGMERFSERLAARGANLSSDGRPITGLDPREILEILLSQAPGGFLVPAHVWTPWFSLLGSRSGFDSVEECFGDLAGEIFALETGLSSDPAMNRLVSSLDRFTLISSSDCHSPEGIGREATIFDTGFDFHSLREAIERGSRDLLPATVEFFPEEGKYHADGHRPCGVRTDPAETVRLGGRCPVCGGRLTVGVLSRVMELADRQTPRFRDDAPAVFHLVPLPEVAASVLGVGAGSRRVSGLCDRFVDRFGSELAVLLEADERELSLIDERVAVAVGKMRRGEVTREPGYDGVYGTIGIG